MAINRDKVLASAVKLLQSGKFEKAIAEFRRLTADDPKDVRTILKIGDAFVKMGRSAEAISSYQQVASIYSDQGFYLKAVAVYKQMLRVDANLPDVHQRLAEMYQQLGLNSDALQHFQQVAVHYERAGDTEKSLSILKQMVDLDPDNVPSRIKLAELFAQQGMNEDATREFRSASDYLLEYDRFDDFIRVGERLIFFDPRALDITSKLADVYLQRGEPKLALGKLQICFKADPRDLSILERIASAFLAMNQTSKTLSVYKEIARIYESKTQPDEAKVYWNKVLELSPSDAEANQALHGAPALAPPSPQPAPDHQPSGSYKAPQSVNPPNTSQAPPQAPAAEAPALTPVAPPQPSEDEQVLRLVTETDVYIKYSLFDKAVEHMKRAVALRPDNLEVHDKLRGIYKSMNKREGMLDELRILVQLGSAQNDRRTSMWRSDLESLQGMPTSDSTDDVYVIEETGDSLIVDTQSLTPAAVDIPATGDDELFAVDDDLDDEHENVVLPPDGALGPPAKSVDEAPMFTPGPSLRAAAESILQEDQVGNDVNPFDMPLAQASDEEFLSSFDQSISLDAPLGNLPAMDPADSTEIIPLSAEEMSEIRSLVSEAGELEMPPVEELPAEDNNDTGPLDLGAIAQEAASSQPNPFAPAVENVFDVPSVPDAPMVVISEEEDEDAELEHIPTLVPEGIEPAAQADMPDFNSPDFQLSDDGAFASDLEPIDLDESILERDNPFAPVESDVFIVPELPELPPAIENLPPPSAFPSMADPVSVPEEEALPEAAAVAEVVEEAQVAPADDASSDAVNLRDALGLAEQAYGFEDDPAGAFFPDELEEAEFFIKQSIFDEAREILEEILDNVPDSPRAQHMLARIVAAEAGEPPPLAPWEQQIVDNLDEDLEEFETEHTDQISIEEVLSQFKKGVAETVDADDAETHYNLGIAYREMGLLDDAILEFQMAAKSKSHAIDCNHLIGLTQIDKANYREALETFERTQGLAGVTKKQKAAAEYERGICFEHLQRFDDAVVAFESAKSLGVDVGDLDERLERARAGTDGKKKG